MSDRIAREQAIDVSRSWIVQAPAGSGKTELLIQRMLALLACVDDAKHVLAITFTNKAAAEMRDRILQALAAAADDAPGEPHKRKTWELARAVMNRHGDRLLRNPGQLTIQTIDSFNATLVRRMPWLSRFGSVPEISDDPETLYQKAVEQLLGQLSAESEQNGALKTLLRHLDNQVQEVQRMLVNMLKKRDQWLGVLLQHSATSRETLEQAVEHYCEEQLGRLQQSFPAVLTEELLWCARYANSQLDQSAQGKHLQLNQLPGAQMADLSEWLFVAELLLTAKGELRKQVTKNNGFPAGKEHKPAKQRVQQLLEDLSVHPDFIQRLAQVRGLPSATYRQDQWNVLHSLIDLLPQLVAELWLVFRAQGQVDFTEIALKAIQSLGDSDNPSDLLLKIDHDLQHILVDEFQDTSRLQYSLLNHLISGWTKGDGRTLFLVGDPMQSIYRFREAEVGLFLHCFKGTFGDLGHPLEPLQLTSNFRSQQGIVAWINTTFAAVFPHQADEMTGAVPLTCAEAVKVKLSGDACRFYPSDGRNDLEEARQVVEIIKQTQAEEGQQSIAILVRGRNHLAEILPLLRQENIAYQAQDVDLLGARPAALDIVHLTRALLHRADRLSWLAVLRAPWCGLTLVDLHVLLADSTKTVPAILAQSESWQNLSVDGRQRLQRVWTVLESFLDQHGRISLRTMIEGCWLALGGRDCCSDQALSDVQRVFDLLETLDQGCDLPSFEQFNRGLMRLYAEADNNADGQLQIMTIHKAKGLEFDVVLIPGLGKMPRHQDAPLLRWFDHPQHGLLMAPVKEKDHQEKDPLYQLLSAIEAEKGGQEAARLLYVATTRAINRLHLFGHAKADSQGEFKPQSGSLLEKLWPVARDHFSDCKPQSVAPESEFPALMMKRLSSDWQAPSLSSVKLAPSVKYDIPSEQQDSDDSYEIFSGWEDPVYRIVGNVVHQYLEKIAIRGVDSWFSSDKAVIKTDIQRSLLASGVSQTQLDFASGRALDALDGCLANARGRWILAAHAQHACELPLTGVIDGKVVHAVIDRTFVVDGIRWVVDYKTASPLAAESYETFYLRQAEKYKKQLNTYAQLFQMLDQTPVKTALYFPLFDGWYELL